MTAIMKREIRNYLKRPLFWLGLVIVFFGVFQELKSYMHIRYVASEQEVNHNLPENVFDGDIDEGFVPSSEDQKREIWENKIRETLISEFKMSAEEAGAVLDKFSSLDVETACLRLEEEYRYSGAIYAYEDAAYHLGTREEINSYLSEKMKEHRFSFYLSRKFADFAGLYMGFFATVMLAVLYFQDTRKNTYELLHTKPVSAWAYVAGKTAGGFGVCLIVLGILNLALWLTSRIYTRGTGFEVSLLDFIGATCLYILPNMLMIVTVYGLVSLLFQNPLPAVPMLILYIVYSNMGSRNAEGVYGYYGRPLAIMVRFPGHFFDTAPPPLVLLNQSFLILASLLVMLLAIQLYAKAYRNPGLPGRRHLSGRA